MRRPLPLVLLLLALFAAACGDGDDAADTTTSSSTTTTDPGLPKDEYVRQANAICKETNAKVEALAEPKTAAAYPAYVRQFVALAQDGQAKLRALRVPAADRPTVEALFLAVNDQQVKLLEDSLPALDAAAKTSKAKAEAVLQPVFTRFGELAATQEAFAKPYGLTDCTDPD